VASPPDGAGSAASGRDRPGPPDPGAFARALADGGVVVFPADTVYGLACDPEQPAAVARMYALKGRPARQPSALMFPSAAVAFEALPELGPRTRALLARLWPGGVTVLLANPRGRFPLAGGGEVLGVRVPVARALAELHGPVLQTSANASGGPDARRLADVPAAIRSGADLTLDGGELPGTPSTVIDLVGFDARGEWAVRRVGAVATETVAAAVAAGWWTH